MKRSRVILIVVAAAALAAAIAAAGCGASSSSSPASSTPAATSSPTAATGSAMPSPNSTSQAAGALTGEVAAAATGDIPDNQVFLTLTDKAAGFSMKYPEGWAQQTRNGIVTIHDKNNIARVAIAPGQAPSVSSVQQDMSTLQQKTPSLKAGAPTAMTITGKPAIKVTYTTQSTPNAVTGKTVTLMVDRYYLSNAGKVAVVDLGTAQGVDNIDAYRMMIESFQWK